MMHPLSEETPVEEHRSLVGVCANRSRRANSSVDNSLGPAHHADDMKDRIRAVFAGPASEEPTLISVRTLKRPAQDQLRWWVLPVAAVTQGALDTTILRHTWTKMTETPLPMRTSLVQRSAVTFAKRSTINLD